MFAKEIAQTQNTQKGIAFIDLQAQKQRLHKRIESAIMRVLDHGHFIMGPEIFELEEKLSAFCGAKHSITCSNGTDALLLILMTRGIKPNDAILVPSFTFAATAEVVAHLGATPIFVDVLPDTFNMDPKSLEQGIIAAKKLGLSPKGAFIVDLYGQPADYDAISSICDQYKIWMWGDAAQSFGGDYKGRKIGTLGECTATSFYPAKPLGCYGDGGAIFTDCDELAKIIKSMRVHGEGSHKYDNVRIGMNGRMDTIQAAILLEKLDIFKDEIAKRQAVATRYNTLLKEAANESSVVIPYLLPNTRSVYAQYTILVDQKRRSKIIKSMTAKGIPTAVHYAKSLHQQPAYAHFPCANKGGLPISEELASRVLSLPMHPYLSKDNQEQVAMALIESCSL